MQGDNMRVKTVCRLCFLARFDLLPLVGLVILVAMMGPVTAYCQSNNDSTSQATTSAENDPPNGIRRGTNEFGVLAAISFDAVGDTPDARFGSIALRYGRVLAANKTLAFEWTIDAFPLAILSSDHVTFKQTGPGTFIKTTTRERVYGAGLAPIGLKFNFRPQRRVQPFASTTGGFLIFKEDVPVAGAAQFNFTFDFNGGIQIVNSSRRAYTLGYKYEHISNGFRSQINPGVDVHVFYVGFSVFR